MKKILAIAALCMVAIGASQAFAATHQQAHGMHMLMVAMRDPGCHWFMAHGTYSKTATAVGSVRVMNYDEKAVKVVSGHVSKLIPVGKSLVLRRGRYVITMVHQASDDNHLKLTVR